MSRYGDALNLVGEYACDLAASTYWREWFRSEGPRGGRADFYQVVDPSEDRVSVAVRPENHYLVYLEKGFATFPMWKLEGKTVPLYHGGQLTFRKVRGVNRWASGTNVYWRRAADGELVGGVEQRRRWVHPGCPPRPFMASALAQAMEEGKGIVAEALIADARDRRRGIKV